MQWKIRHRVEWMRGWLDGVAFVGQHPRLSWSFALEQVAEVDDYTRGFRAAIAAELQDGGDGR